MGRPRTVRARLAVAGVALYLIVATLVAVAAYFTPTWNLEHTEVVVGWGNAWRAFVVIGAVFAAGVGATTLGYQLVKWIDRGEE